MVEEWPDLLHLQVLRHLGSPQEVWGYLPYGSLCRSCRSATQLPCLWRHLDFTDAPLEEPWRLLSGHPEVIQLVLRGLSIEDSTLQELLLRLPRLQVLDVGRCGDLTPNALTSACSLTQLQSLSLDGMAALEDSQVQDLCESCLSLNHLDLRFCERLADVSCFLKSADRWQSLQFDGCFRLDATRLLECANVFSSLEELSLDGEMLEAPVLALLPKRCPRLRTLLVSFAAELDGEALSALTTLSQLDALTLKKAQKPPDDAWASFFLQQQRCRAPEADLGWRILNFCECELFCDGAANTLALVPQVRLVELDLSWCWNLGDRGLAALLNVAPGLQRLRLAGMKSLSAHGLVPCSRMANLEELDCTACNSVSDSFLEFLLRLFAGPLGSAGDALPGLVPPAVRHASETLWAKRKIWAPRPEIRNYYAQRLEDWSQLRAANEVANFAEPLLANEAALP